VLQDCGDMDIGFIKEKAAAAFGRRRFFFSLF
jgi:hypothetical protein